MFSQLIDIERLIHSLKTMIACLIGFLLTRFIGLGADQWIVITILVIMCAQIYVGSVIQKAVLRFLGTLAGCLVATVSLVGFSHTSLSTAITLGIASFIFSYLATLQENLTYAGTLGAVTTAIILLGQNPTVSFAAMRFLEISVGILIAALVSQFILPIHARTHLRRTQANTLAKLRDYYQDSLIDHTAKLDDSERDEAIVKALTKQRQLAKEATKEPFGDYFDPKIFVQSLHCEKEILRSIDFMHHALIHLNSEAPGLLTQSSALDTFNDMTIEALTMLINALNSTPAKRNKKAAVHIHVPTLAPLWEELEKNTSNLPLKTRGYTGGFLFSAEMLVNNLTQLAYLYRIPLYGLLAETASEEDQTLDE